MPDNSSILLNVGQLNESSYQGFNDAQISAIPLSASSPSISLTLGIGLHAELDLGIDILSGDGSKSAFWNNVSAVEILGGVDSLDLF